ncbi:MAG TPA: DUF2845 domain-containing protein [Burkholderiaceae bacterium]|nr:DUF2845 domain-containing protein [Burkholderiaceae bacterium]
MRFGMSVWVCAAWLGVCGSVQAESLRCSNGIADEGDSRLAVVYKCGVPLLADSRCAPVFYAQTLNPVPDPFASMLVPCLPVEEWLYDRGQGNLMATVHFRSGRVQSIVYGRTPQ